jgi:trehalose synthase
MIHYRHIPGIRDYEPLVGKETVERILEKARPLAGTPVVHINSTAYGGGVAEILTSMSLLMNSVGLKAGWRVIQGSTDFFSVTKKMHNALQGGKINLSERKKQIYEDTIRENAIRNHLHHDVVIVHDPQPLPMILHYRKQGPWIWRAHIEMSSPNDGVLDYLSQFITHYDASILTLEEYRYKLDVPQVFFYPAIDPFIVKNRALPESALDERLKHFGIPTDLPLVVQVSRFDRWKDPAGVIRAFKLARKEVPATLVLLGNVADDDPEGEKVYHSLLGEREDRILITTRQDTALVNALQSRAAVVLQKSIKEGFGLTVAETMWKGKPVIGGNVGGIRHQIQDGVNGFLVSTVEEAADRIVRLLKDPELRLEMGIKAKETVRNNFLMSRLLEDYLDLFNSFETDYRLKKDYLSGHKHSRPVNNA